MKIGTFNEFRGFTGTIEYDFENRIHCGRLLGTTKPVRYTGDSIWELYDNFKKAVYDYGPTYVVADAIEFISKRCDIDKAIIEKVLIAEEDYMRSIGIIVVEDLED